MQIDSVDIVAEVWKILVDYIPAREREAAAEQFITALRRMDFSEYDLIQLAETDHHIDDVLALEQAEEELYDDTDDADDYEGPSY
jgi:hypothetical protein